jgi:hypothetical protein
MEINIGCLPNDLGHVFSFGTDGVNSQGLDMILPYEAIAIPGQALRAPGC